MTGKEALLPAGQLLEFLLVTALVIGLAYWVTRLMARRFGSGRPGRYLRLVDAMGLGPHRGVGLVEVAGRFLVVGFAEQNVSLLASFSRDELAACLEGQEGAPTAASRPGAEHLWRVISDRAAAWWTRFNGRRTGREASSPAGAAARLARSVSRLRAARELWHSRRQEGSA